MRYLVLACDYDGTLARHGVVDAPTVAALERVRASGRRLLLVTGRELDDLARVFPRLDLFERVVAENGALVFHPATREVTPLGEPPPPAFVAALRAAAVTPLSIGRVIVATREPHETTVLEAIRTLGLELQVIFNKGAVMVLPAGVNKATGLAAALDAIGLSPHEVVGVGDAENDHAFLALCECGVAVANALATVKERADLVTTGDHGDGVIELADRLIATDLAEVAPARHQIELGTSPEGTAERLAPVGTNVLLVGPSGSGKSTVATGLLERLAERRYQFCIVDPEGDYGALACAVTVGDADHEPVLDEVLTLLERPRENVVVNLLAVPLGERPAAFAALLPRLQELRARTGRPHRVVIDEAHHLLPAAAEPTSLPRVLDGLVLITVHADRVAPALLGGIELVLAVGDAPHETLGRFAARVGRPAPPAATATLASGAVVAWRPGAAPRVVQTPPPSGVRRRHRRKYAEGELGPDKSFYFSGPADRLKLRAQNLVLFLQLADGVDDATWLHHLQRGDYSRWFRDAIKDEELAAEATAIEEGDTRADAAMSRAAIRAAVSRRYTLPATDPAAAAPQARAGDVGREGDG